MKDSTKALIGIVLLFIGYLMLGWGIPVFFYPNLSKLFYPGIMLYIKSVGIWHLIIIISALVLQNGEKEEKKEVAC